MLEKRRALLLALAAWPAWPAWPFSGIAASEAPANLRRWGSGEFRRFGFLIYEATLWAGDDPQQPPLLLRLDYKRDISGTDLVAASVREMRRTVADEARLREWGERLARIFPDVKAGDHLIGDYRPEGALFVQDGRELGGIRDADFARAFFGIWLDPRTSAPGLRASLLQQTGA